MKRLLIVVFALLLVSPVAAQTPATIRLGIIGDSASDEYRGSDNRGGAYASVTRNWIELLQVENIARPGTWGSWGGIRRTGYEYNWALSGARTEGIQDQANGLATQISALRSTSQTSDDIGAVIIWIGSNNFATYAGGSYTAICTGALSGQPLSDFIEQRAAHIEQAVQTVRAADPNMRLLIVTIPDVNNSPAIAGCGDPDGAMRVTGAINQTNELIADIITTYGAAILSAADALARLPGNAAAIVAAGGGGFSFDANSVGDAPTNGILGDSIHSGTILNCITANEVIAALNTRYALSLPRISDVQCLARVGYTVIPTATPAATITAAQTAAPTSVSTFTLTPTNTATLTPSVVPSNTPTVTPSDTSVPTATPTDAPTAEPTFTFTPSPCAVSNTGLEIARPFGFAFDRTPSWFSLPIMVNAPEGAPAYVADVFVINRSIVITPRVTGVLSMTIAFTDAPSVQVCFTVN